MAKLFRLIAAVVLIIPAPLLSWGDEIVLKDGKKIEWTSIKDNGDTYEVTAPNGVKTTLKKENILDVIVGPSIPILTGALFEFKANRKVETVDLFKGLDVEKAPSSGSWSTLNGALVGSHQGAGTTHIEFSAYNPPEEYDLSITAERVSGTNHFSATLPGGGRQFTVYFDAFEQTIMEIS